MPLQFITTPDTIPKITHHKNSRKHKRKLDLTDEEYLETTIEWFLSISLLFIPEDSMMMEVHYNPAVAKLTEELRADLLLVELNSKNIFDFEYLPNEGDYFVVRHKHVYESIQNRRRPVCDFYMGFIFRQGKWVADFYRTPIIAKQHKKGIIAFL